MVRRTLEGKRRHVLHLKTETLSIGESQVGQVRHEDQSTEYADAKSADAGSEIGAASGISDQEVRQNSAQKGQSPVSREAGAGTLGAVGAPDEVEDIEDFIDEVLE